MMTKTSTLRSVMLENVATIEPHQPVRLAIQMMVWASARHLPVVREGDLIGIISESDLLKVATDPDGLDVGSVMSSPVETAHPDDDIEKTAMRMTSEGLGFLAVVDEAALVGFVTTSMLLARLAQPEVRPRADLTVRDVMSSVAIAIGPEDDVMDAAATMLHERVRHLPVIDSDRRVVGIVSDRDLRTAVGDPVVAIRDDQPEAQDPWPIESLMTANPISIQATAPLADLAACFLDDGVGAVPVVDDRERLIGIVSYVDLLHHAFRGAG